MEVWCKVFLTREAILWLLSYNEGSPHMGIPTFMFLLAVPEVYSLIMSTHVFAISSCQSITELIYFLLVNCRSGIINSLNFTLFIFMKDLQIFFLRSAISDFSSFFFPISIKLQLLIVLAASSVTCFASPKPIPIRYKLILKVTVQKL